MAEISRWVTPGFLINSQACRGGIPSGIMMRSRASSSSRRNKIMRLAAHAIVVTAGVVGLIGSAFAAAMTGLEIKAFLSGKTVYLETTTASSSGQAGQGI